MHEEEPKPFTWPVLCQAEAGNSSGEALGPDHARDGSRLPGTLNPLGPLIQLGVAAPGMAKLGQIPRAV